MLERAHIDLLGLGIGCVILYQGYVSLKIALHRSFSRKQKAYQLLLVWLVPLIGAAVVHVFFSADSAPQKVHDTRFFTDGGNNPPGIGG